MTTDTDQLATVRRILYPTDNDIEASLGFFSDTTVFRMGNADPVVGREAIMQCVGGYLAPVEQQLSRRSRSGSPTRVSPYE